MRLWLWLATVAGALAASGCATLVSDDPPPAYAPISAKPPSGIVSYNPEGIKEIVDARRNDAYRKIFEFCGSRQYKIAKQTTVKAKDSAAADSIATFGAEKVVELHFVCE